MLSPEQASKVNNRELVRAVVERLGVGEVAGWCKVTPHAVYRWFGADRGSDDEPIPSRHALCIVRNAGRRLSLAERGALLPGLEA